ncbi:MAG: Ig-like domain repeat protein, partial [Candidatus Heimdallarchaeota archaeon]|nr:Ig-like domain repeat protein [Candidatus Heimdallarchaeota archaeon]
SFNQLVYVAKAETTIELNFYYDNYQPMLGGILNSILPLSGEQIHIYINGTYLKSLSVDTLGEFLTSLGLSPGLYNISVKFDGNRNHLGSEKTLEVIISKTPTQLNGDVDVYHEYNEESSFIILLTDTLSNPIQANLIITIDGNYFATVSTNSSGYAIVTLTSDLAVGNYELIIEFQGDSTFYQSSLSVNLVVKYRIELVSIEFDAASYGDAGYISGMIESFSGLLDQVTITMYLDGSPLQTFTDSTGYFLFTISQFLDSGAFTIILRIDESGEIFFFEYQFMIEREKASYDVSLTSQTVVFNAESSITGYISVLGVNSSNVELEVFLDGVFLGNLYTDSFGQFIIPA